MHLRFRASSCVRFRVRIKTDPGSAGVCEVSNAARRAGSLKSSLKRCRRGRDAELCRRLHVARSTSTMNSSPSSYTQPLRSTPQMVPLHIDRSDQPAGPACVSRAHGHSPARAPVDQAPSSIVPVTSAGEPVDRRVVASCRRRIRALLSARDAGAAPHRSLLPWHRCRLADQVPKPTRS